MEEYRTEAEQVEALKKWLTENGKSIIAGIAIGLIALFGWRDYNQRLEVNAQNASTLYEQMIIAAQNNDSENIRVYADRIIAEYESSIYATFATLMLAKMAVETKQLDQAEIYLRWVLEHNDQPELEHIARLRLARVYITSGKLEQADKLLTTSDPGKFIAAYEELRGDLLVRQGRNTEARDAYQRALLNIDTPEIDKSILEMKLDDLGRG